jgi:hypothetical protein
MSTATVTADLLNVRNKPGLDSTVIGMVPGGARIEVQSVENGWAAVALQAGGVTLQTSRGQVVTGFCATDWLDLGGVGIPVSPDTRFKLGVNSLTHGREAAQEASAGCKFFLCANDFTGGHEIKQAHPDAVVMVRRFLDHNVVPSVDQIIHGLEGASYKDLIYTGLNEADQLGPDGNDLRRRAQLDLEVAQRIRQISGAMYAAGTFSMGTPDFTNDETCAIIREFYAPAYNRGEIALDMHLYSPNPQHIDQPGEHKWFERRWEFLFIKCGFDPKVRAIYSSECGLDEGGVGGFKAHAYNSEQFEDWCRKYIALQSAPLVIDGVSYPSPIIGGAIFQLGSKDDSRWDGYDITNYLPALRRQYGVTPAPATRARGEARRLTTIRRRRKPEPKPKKTTSSRASKTKGAKKAKAKVKAPSTRSRK